jgi:predicted Zn finger-like uncharacterized protein
MIVICTKCQAKFRVADDKIGPRGAKVRCSKCQTVFVVHPVLGTQPVTDGDARHAPAQETAAPPPPPADLAPAGTPPPVPDRFTSDDPFAAPAPDPFGPAPVDPFAPPAAQPPDPFGGADPFAAQPAPGGESLGAPFVAAVSHRSTLPVTDLSDLMGAPAAATPPPLSGAAQVPPPLPPAPPSGDPFARPEAAAPPTEDPFARPEAAAPPAEADPFAAQVAAAAPAPALADPFGSEDPFAGAAAPAGPPEPDLDLATPAGRSLDDGGLALEDRLTPPPSRIAPAAGAPADLDQTLETATPAGGGAPDPFAAFPAPPAGGAAEPFDPGAFDFGGGDLGVPEPAPAPPPAPSPPAAAPRVPAPADAAQAVAAAAPAVATAQAAAAGEGAGRIPGGRTSRLRMVAVNAIALFALLVVALAIWAVWRTDGPLEAASLRPSAILAALRRGGAPGAWVTQDVRSGVYDRARGAPLLFVRGRVVSRAAAPVRGLTVAVQVVRGGQVLARGEALAGAVPTEEELYFAADDAAIAAVTRTARARAPGAVRPGDAVPFLVPVGDAPPDLEGASLRIDVAAAAADAAGGAAGGAAP